MSGSPVRCPAPDCDWSAPAADARCPEHGLLAVEARLIDRTRPWLGHVIDDRYALIGYLGGGGHGAVYRGRDLRLGRDVAVKLLNPAIVGSASLRQRFEREARLLSGLRSVHTLTVFDYGVADGQMAGVAFMVTELVEGPSLARRLRQGPIEADEWLTITAQVVRSLTEAHRQGIVHRDLKPGNILLARDPDGGLETRVIDLGIARLEGEGQTTSGAIVGTPRYMAPEQFGTEGARIDARTDVYALALVVWEMIAGRKAYDVKGVIPLLNAKMTQPVPRLPSADDDSRRARIDAVLRVAFARRPAERFDSADAFLDALMDAAAPDDGSPAPLDAPLTLMGPERPSPVGDGPKRRALAAAIVLIVALVGGLFIWRAWPLDRPSPPDVEPARPTPGVMDAVEPDTTAPVSPGATDAASPVDAGTPDASADAEPEDCPRAILDDIRTLAGRRRCADARAVARGHPACRADVAATLEACRPPPTCSAERIASGVSQARAARSRSACRAARERLHRACRGQSIPSARSVCGICGDGTVQTPFETCDPEITDHGGYCDAKTCRWIE